MQLLDIPFDLDTSIEGKKISVIGRMGVPESSPFTKLIVENLVLHNDIAARAHALPDSDQARSAEENWLRAERELLLNRGRNEPEDKMR